MHTTDGDRFRFFHNGDFSGHVRCMDKETEEMMEIPFDDLKVIVAAGVRSARLHCMEEWDAPREEVDRVENMSDDEILGIP